MTNQALEIVIKIFTGLSSLYKLFWGLIVCFLIFWVDSRMGFTYHYFNDKKISAIIRYNDMIKDPKIDSADKAKFVKLRDAIIVRNRDLFDPVNKHEPYK